jgi:hypothetical protein
MRTFKPHPVYQHHCKLSALFVSTGKIRKAKEGEWSTWSDKPEEEFALCWNFDTDGQYEILRPINLFERISLWLSRLTRKSTNTP